MNISQYSKAIVALIVPLLVSLFALSFGVNWPTTITDAHLLVVTAIVTAVGVYLVPNKKVSKTAIPRFPSKGPGHSSFSPQRHYHPTYHIDQHNNDDPNQGLDVPRPSFPHQLSARRTHSSLEQGVL